MNTATALNETAPCPTAIGQGGEKTSFLTNNTTAPNQCQNNSPATGIMSPEYCTLAACLFDGKIVPEVVTELGDHPDLFEDEGHRLIWSAIVNLHRDGIGVDFSTVYQFGVEHGTASGMGGGAYLAEMDSAGIRITEHLYHARQVREAWKSRRLALLGRRLETTVRRDGPGAALNLIQAEIVALGGAEGAGAGTSQLPPFADLLRTFDVGTEDIPMLFDDAMPLSEMAVIASEPGAGKSTLAIGLGLSIAFGRAFVAGFTPKRRGRVCFLLAEDGEIACSARIMAWCAEHGITRDQYEAAVTEGRIRARYGDSAALLDFSGSTLQTTPAYAELLAEVTEHRYDLLVVDSLLEWASVPDENSNAMMHAAARALIRLARASGGVVLTLHHTNKTSDRTGDTGLHSVRGGGALAGKVRWAVVLTGLTPEDMKTHGVQEEDKFRYLKVHSVKNQYAARDGRPVYLERTRGILQVVEMVKPAPADTLAPLARAVADKIGANRANRTKRDILRDADFRAELKVDHKNATTDRIRAAYLLAVDNGWLVEDSDSDAAGDAPKIPRIPSFEVAA